MPKHEFFMDMTCEGCLNAAVSCVLNKLGGIQFEIDLPNKKVSIDSTQCGYIVGDPEENWEKYLLSRREINIQRNVVDWAFLL